MTGAQQSFDCLVLGAGLAGMSAAEAAAALGLRIAMVDLYGTPGGQYGMAIGSGREALQRSAAARSGRAAAARCAAAGVKFFGDCEAFAVELGFALGLCNGAREALVLSAPALIVAAGAHEVVKPFPGWTLPGVMTAGAAQRLLKEGSAPGKRTLLAGSGPFLFAVAETFHRASQPLAGMVEVARPFARAHRLTAFPERWGEALRLLASARRATRRIWFGHAVVAALGKERLEAVRVAPVDEAGRPDQSRAVLLDGVDALCVSHGFQPVIEVPLALGAEHAFDPRLGGWHCRADQWTGATSLSGLYVAGETAGLGGARPAELSGRLAGWAVAEAQGKAVPEALRERSLKALRHARRFAYTLSELWPPVVIDVTTPDTVLCRCEGVSRADVDAAIKDGARDVGLVKLWTRAGMGYCQGRFCAAAVAERLKRTDAPPAALAPLRPQFPLRPVPAAAARAWAESAASAPWRTDHGIAAESRLPRRSRSGSALL